MTFTATYAPALHLVILACAPVVIALHHSALARLNRLLSKPYSNQSVCLLSILVSSVAETVLLLLFGLLGGPSFFPALLYSATLYLALGYTYFHLFNMSETARRIRLLYEIERSGGVSGLTVNSNAASDIPAADKSVTTRLARLEALGQINRLKSGAYVTSGVTLLFGARTARLWGLLIGIDILTGR